MERTLYILYVNGNVYGKGGFGYMKELIADYVDSCDMYGADSVEFKIVKRKTQSEAARQLK